MNKKSFKDIIIRGNDLTQVGYNYTINEMNLIKFILNYIDTTKNNPGSVNIYPSDFVKIIGNIDANILDNMEKDLHSIMLKPIKIYGTDEDNNEKITLFPWFSEIEYLSNKEGVTYFSVDFSPQIIPYLSKLKNRLKTFNIECADKLTTQFAYYLYTLLTMPLRNSQINELNENGKVSTGFDIESMKKKTGLSEKYNRWDKFKSQILIPAIEQINSKTDIRVNWSPVKYSRAISGIHCTYTFGNTHNCRPVKPCLPTNPEEDIKSNVQIEWMKECLKLLLEYKDSIKKYDTKAVVSIVDLGRMVYFAIKTGNKELYKNLKEEKEQRELMLISSCYQD